MSLNKTSKEWLLKNGAINLCDSCAKSGKSLTSGVLCPISDGDELSLTWIGNNVAECKEYEPE